MATTQWKKNNITYDIHDSRLPSSYGTAGQVLATNLSGTGIEWVNQSGGTSYTAGDNIQINNNVISATDTTYTAGTNITIDANNVISSSGTSYTAVDDIIIDNNEISTVYGGAYNPGTLNIIWNFNGSWTTGSGGIAYLEIGTSAREPKFVPGTTYNYEIIVDGVTYTGQSVVNAMEGTNWMRIGDVYTHLLSDAYSSSSSYITWSTAGHVVTRVKVYTQATQPTYTPIDARYVPIDNSTITINGSGKIQAHEPNTYLKSASSTGNTLTLVNKDNSTTTFTPTSDVNLVNGQAGVVVLDAEDVGALPDTTSIPTKTSDLTNDGDGTNPFLTLHQSLAAYSTTTLMNTAIAAHHDETKQDTLIAGTNIDITNNVISASEPGAYLKSANITGNTLTLTNKDDTSLLFTPTSDVTSVNGYSGAVTLNASDVGANYTFNGSLNKNDSLVGSEAGTFISSETPVVYLKGVKLTQSSANTWTFQLDSTPTIDTSTQYRILYALYRNNGGYTSSTKYIYPTQEGNVYTFTVNQSNLGIITIDGTSVTVTTTSPNFIYLGKLTIINSNSTFSYIPIDIEYLGLPTVTSNSITRDNTETYYSRRGWLNMTDYGVAMIGTSTAGQRALPTTPGDYRLKIQVTGDGTQANPYMYTYLITDDYTAGNDITLTDNVIQTIYGGGQSSSSVTHANWSGWEQFQSIRWESQTWTTRPDSADNIYVTIGYQYMGMSHYDTYDSSAFTYSESSGGDHNLEFISPPDDIQKINFKQDGTLVVRLGDYADYNQYIMTDLIVTQQVPTITPINMNYIPIRFSLNGTELTITTV